VHHSVTTLPRAPNSGTLTARESHGAQELAASFAGFRDEQASIRLQLHTYFGRKQHSDYSRGKQIETHLV
jgi:hypothetical protein